MSATTEAGVVYTICGVAITALGMIIGYLKWSRRQTRQESRRVEEQVAAVRMSVENMSTTSQIYDTSPPLSTTTPYPQTF